MTQVKEEKKDNSNQKLSHLAILSSDWDLGSNITISTKDPRNINYAFSDETVSLMVNSGKNLFKTSKNPSLANHVTHPLMQQKVNELHNSYEVGVCVVASSNANDYEYEIQDGGKVASAIKELLSPNNRAIFQTKYNVTHRKTEDTYSATNIDSIVKTLKAAGNLIGNLSGINFVDSKQITGMVADIVKDLGDTYKDNWQKNLEDEYFFAFHKDTGSTASSAAGVMWTYSASVNEVSKCCTHTINSHYLVEAYSCIFYDQDRLVAVYKDVTGKTLNVKD